MHERMWSWAHPAQQQVEQLVTCSDWRTEVGHMTYGCATDAVIDQVNQQTA